MLILMLGNALKLALQEIRRNVLRSFLTTLGIIIGVAAVITMVTVGNGATEQVKARVSSLGSNLMMINRGQGFGPGSRDRVKSPGFELEDLAAIELEIAGIKAIAPVSAGSATLIHGNSSWSSTVRGTTDEYLTAGNWVIAEGRSFTADEDNNGGAVCIIGQTIVGELFADQSPLDQKIRVGSYNCTVIGVLKAKGQTSFGNDQDDIVLMPFPTFQKRIAGDREVQQIYISLQDGIDSEHVEDRLNRLLRLRRNIAANEDDNYNIMDTTELAETLTSTTQTLTGLLGAVAGVSLLVGGIGIMNIMLVSVTERTREIGIRLAIGALEHEVLWQFLVEAVVLSSLGGLMGIGLAVGLSYSISVFMHLPFTMDPGIMIGSFVFSSAVGVVFGYFPAHRAARLDPIEALRHE
ncbi:ABC transporter permease [Gynuella sunshinyii]|uniref:ABC-type antimicrobial peptide transport system, permease component n=1 Tax=Gynuella sunshinyii YC6258 TaxID=1445510 RepID=A0A0C5VGK8_9GAMM|nr:ABC transporter permease [Gynuella sunshinyii]AJQ92533.1 ABC-type antimicrobial peptide transport system, permease component [Gynuella sunshinyii YC6258]